MPQPSSGPGASSSLQPPRILHVVSAGTKFWQRCRIVNVEPGWVWRLWEFGKDFAQFDSTHCINTAAVSSSSTWCNKISDFLLAKDNETSISGPTNYPTIANMISVEGTFIATSGLTSTPYEKRSTKPSIGANCYPWTTLGCPTMGDLSCYALLIV